MNDLTCTIPVLETDRLILSAHRREDHAAVADMWSDTEVTHHVMAGQISTPRDSWMRMLAYLGLWPLLGYGYWAVREKSTGEISAISALRIFTVKWKKTSATIRKLVGCLQSGHTVRAMPVKHWEPY